MLGAICGSAISMDLLAQSMDPYSAQRPMYCADICGSLSVVACASAGKIRRPANDIIAHVHVCCAISVVSFVLSFNILCILLSKFNGSYGVSQRHYARRR